MRSKKIENVEVTHAARAANGPRLVKAAEVVARKVVRSSPREARPVVRPLRMPRGATEARAIFDSLFAEQAKAS
jgi:hypothetical protein